MLIPSHRKLTVFIFHANIGFIELILTGEAMEACDSRVFILVHWPEDEEIVSYLGHGHKEFGADPQLIYHHT